MQRLFGQLAFVRRVQVEEFTASMRHAANFGDALLEAGLVAGEIITNQLANPRAEEVTGMFAGTAGAEVVDHGLQVSKGRGAVGPDVSPVGFLLARCEHRYRGFVGMNHVLCEHCFAQGINQRLELHAGLSDPLR
ncbi:hypothetical protein FQZ97_722560 [compost metagenome]